MVLSFTFEGKVKAVSFESGRYKLEYPCESKETCSPYESYFPAGKYRFEVHGAAGGSPEEEYISPGGFSSGTILLKNKTHLYFYIGAKGVCGTNTPNVFGGGGRGQACSGGGASDIRIGEDLLNHRIIVAGGSGGYGFETNHHPGGKGGGESGTDGITSLPNDAGYAYWCVGGGKGTQTSGGTSYYNDVGTFGYGGNKTRDNGSGGGGGWFGGGAGGGCLSGGGGGSGFVFVKINSNIKLDSKYFLLEGKTDFGTNKNDGFIYIEPMGGFFQKFVSVVKCNGSIFDSSFLYIFEICK